MDKNREVVVVSYSRTPFGKLGGKTTVSKSL